MKPVNLRRLLGVGGVNPNDNPNEFIRLFVQQASEYFHGGYRLRQIRAHSTTGALQTSLPTDVFSLLTTLTDALEGYVDENGLESTERGHKIRVEALLGTVRAMMQVHKAHVLLFWTSLESCCAAANDFSTMADSIQNWSDELLSQHPYLSKRCNHGSQTNCLIETCSELSTLYSQNAAHAVERSVVFILRALDRDTNSNTKLFSFHWERDCTDNELVRGILQIVDEYLSMGLEYLGSDYLYEKLVLAASKGVVCYYLRNLIERADLVRRKFHSKLGKVRRKQSRPFSSPKMALRRMEDDIAIIRDFFDDNIAGNIALSRILASNFHVLDLLHECLISERDDLETFVVVIHKHTGSDLLVTQCLVRDLWLLVSGRVDRVQECWDALKPDLAMVSNGVKEVGPRPQRSELVYANLEDMLRSMYEDRLVQGMLPVCWICIPKENDTGGPDMTHSHVRSFSRSINEIRTEIKAYRSLDCI